MTLAVNEHPQNIAPREPREAKVPIPIGPKGVQLDNIEAAWRLAMIVCKSPFCPKGLENPESMTVAMLYCASIGLDPVMGPQNIAVINGRPSLWGDSMLGLIIAQPDCVDVVETFENDIATCTVFRGKREPVVRSFSYADAKQAGLMGKQGPWSQYPKRMAQMRARAWACRDAYADVLRGIHVAEEAEDMPEREIKVTRVDKVQKSIDAGKANQIEHPTPKPVATSNRPQAKAESAPVNEAEKMLDAAPVTNEIPETLLNEAAVFAEKYDDLDKCKAYITERKVANSGLVNPILRDAGVSEIAAIKDFALAQQIIQAIFIQREKAKK